MLFFGVPVAAGEQENTLKIALLMTQIAMEPYLDTQLGTFSMIRSRVLSVSRAFPSNFRQIYPIRDNSIRLRSTSIGP